MNGVQGCELCGGGGTLRPNDVTTTRACPCVKYGGSADAVNERLKRELDDARHGAFVARDLARQVIDAFENTLGAVTDAFCGKPMPTFEKLKKELETVRRLLTG